MVVCISATTSGRKNVCLNHKCSNKGRFRPQVAKITSNSTTSGQPKNACKSGKKMPHEDHIGFAVCGSAGGVLRPCFLGRLPHRIAQGMYSELKSSHRAAAWRVRGPTASAPGTSRGRAVGFVGRCVKGLELVDSWMFVAMVVRGRQALAGRVFGSSTE